MKITLLLMAALIAVVPILGAVPTASAEEVVTYPDVLHQWDTLYFNPNLLVTDSSTVTGSIIYKLNTGYPTLNIKFYKMYSGTEPNYNYIAGVVAVKLSSDSSYSHIPFYFYSSDSTLVGVNLSSFAPLYPDYTFLESDLSKPVFLLSSYTYEGYYDMALSTNDLDIADAVFALDPNVFLSTEDNIVIVWGEIAAYVGGTFAEVGNLLYDTEAEELTLIGSLACILAGIALLLLVWNIIRSFLPMRG